VTRDGDVLDLAEGTRLVLGSQEWTVVLLVLQLGQVRLRNAAGQERVVSVRALMHDPGCRTSTRRPGLPSSSRGRQPASLGDLTPHEREIAANRYAHLMEAESGYRSGDPLSPRPGEPRQAYDPDKTTLTQRRQAKAAELRSMPAEEARMLGLASVSERSLRRWAAAASRFGPIGCASGAWLRRAGLRTSMTPEIREAVLAVYQETLHRARVSMKTKERMICQYVAENFGQDVPVPSYPTLWRVWREWFGPGGSRQKYARSAERQKLRGGHVVVTRPGQVIALDTTEMAVMVREHVFGDPVPVYLTLAIDVYTHSIVAFRLTLVSDTSVDVAMLLRDVMMPLPLRDDWGEDMEWPYPGVPASLIAGFAGHKVAALPFFAPETVTTDHGSVYKNHHLVEVEKVIGANILPARVLRPADKDAVERAFSGIQSLLLEHLLGYRGVDVADRGADPEGDAVLTIAEMEHMIATWVVKIWQNRVLGEFAPVWDPGGTHSPNTLFAAAMSQGGFSLQIPTPELYYQLLRVHRVRAIHHRRGVKVRGLYYNGPVFNEPHVSGPSCRGGVYKGLWEVRSDPRDRRFAYFQDPLTHDWHTLRWTGLPAEGQVPAFADTRVEELLRAVRKAGLRPRSDAELLPELLKLIGGHIPVDSWPTQMSKKKRKQHAREVLQGQAAAADRPAAPGATPARHHAADATVVPLRQDGFRERAKDVAAAVDGERHRRRRAAASAPAAPPPVIPASRRRSLLTIPDDDDPDDREHE